MRESRVRHIHAHFAVGSATCAWVLARFLRLPFSFTAHAYDIWQDRLLLSEKLRGAAFVVTCTEYNRRHLLQLVPNLTRPIHVVYHGVDTQRFVPTARPVRAVPRILAVGRLCEQKGFATLLRGCAMLAQWGEPFECTIVGDGPLADSLRVLARQLELDERIHFLGRAFQEQMPDHYAQSDLFVLPCTRANDNDRDGIPNTIKEAMATGLAVVSTWFSGVPELVVDEVTGLLVAPDHPEALARAMQRLLQSPDLRCRFGTAGRERVVIEASMVAATAQLAALFDTSHPPSE
jgi:glycosyltransferase involved in cell wall biosynthesis